MSALWCSVCRRDIDYCRCDEAIAHDRRDREAQAREDAAWEAHCASMGLPPYGHRTAGTERQRAEREQQLNDETRRRE